MKDPIKLLLQKLTNWYEIVTLNLPNFLLAVIVFGLSYLLSRKLNSYLSNKLLKNRVKQESLRLLIANLSSFVLIAIGILLSLSALNLDGAIKSLLAGAGVAGLAVGLALKGALSNIFSGMVLSVKDFINVGDWVESNGYSGSVEKITLRNTFIREKDNNLVIIPNSTFLSQPFKNYGITASNKLIIKCGVHYDSNLREVKKVLFNMIEENFPLPSQDKKPQILFNNFGGTSIDFEMRFWFDPNTKSSHVEAKSEAIILIQEYFAKANIDIPYPIRTVIHANNN